MCRLSDNGELDDLLEAQVSNARLGGLGRSFNVLVLQFSASNTEIMRDNDRVYLRSCEI